MYVFVECVAIPIADRQTDNECSIIASADRHGNMAAVQSLQSRPRRGLASLIAMNEWLTRQISIYRLELGRPKASVLTHVDRQGHHLVLIDFGHSKTVTTHCING